MILNVAQGPGSMAAHKGLKFGCDHFFQHGDAGNMRGIAQRDGTITQDAAPFGAFQGTAAILFIELLRTQVKNRVQVEVRIDGSGEKSGVDHNSGCFSIPGAD